MHATIANNVINVVGGGAHIVKRCQGEKLPSLLYFPVEIADDVMINDVENRHVRAHMQRV